MKVSLAGGILLLIILVLVILNALYIHRTTEDLSRRINTLPMIPDENTVRRIIAFQDYFESKLPLLRFTVSFPQLDRVAELSEELAAYAQNGTESEYQATRRLLLNAIEDMRRLERLWPSFKVRA